MAKITAPKSPDYDARIARQKRVSDIKALRNKPSRTPADQDKLIQLLVDHMLANETTP